MTTDEHTAPEAEPGATASAAAADAPSEPDVWAYLWADDGGSLVTVAGSPAAGATAGSAAGAHRDNAPSWWHRTHPIFTSLVGFFTGLFTVVLIPGTFGAVLSKVFDDDTAARLFPFATVVFAIPLVLVAFPRTRRFGSYMLAGMLITAVVVAVAAALTLWVLISHDR